MTNSAMPTRYEQLDSLRGAASLSVVAFHYLTRFKFSEASPDIHGGVSEKLVFLMQKTPLRLLCTGHEPVILFFVLSGFVLALPYLSKRAAAYPAFVLKRILRIYALYLVMLAVAVPLRDMLYAGGIPALSEWFNAGWTSPPNRADAILSYIFLMGEFDATHYNGVVWTLTHEMRISLLFPLLMWAYTDSGWKLIMTGAFALSLLAYTILLNNLSTLSYVMSIHYTSMFLFGFVLAKYRERLSAFAARLKPPQKAALLLAAVALYIFQSWCPGGIDEIWGDWLIATGGGLLIVILLSWKGAARAFRHKLPLFFGRISYSVYVWHIVALYALMYALYGTMPAGWIAALAFAVTVGASWLSYRYIEQPMRNI
ncbi:acyltransferase [Clostridia bacterium]|nr:acyltransferase [Clostridia bacterium]